MSHKLVSLHIGEGEYYTRIDADNVLAEKEKEIAELQAQKAQAEDDCAYWKALAQKRLALDNTIKEVK